MKAKFFSSALVVLFTATSFYTTLANATPAETVGRGGSTLSAVDPGGPGKKAKRKAKKAQKGKHKKISRKYCMYCPPTRLFEKGQWDASAGAGVIPTYLMDKATVLVPPVSLGVDYRFSEKFSLGAAAGHSVSESRPITTPEGIVAQWTNKHYTVGLRPGIHITRKENWDFYGGFSVGVNFSHLDGKTDFEQADMKEIQEHMGIKERTVSPSFYGFTGMRYVVSPKWTLNGEVGFGISIFTVGCTYLLHKNEKTSGVTL